VRARAAIPCHSVLGKGGDVLAVPKAGNFAATQRVEVPPGMLWLQGDNKDNSTDSRDYGPVPYGLIRGKVFVRVWPPGEAGWVKNEAWRSVPAE
jgi:inner membrane protease subunit 1